MYFLHDENHIFPDSALFKQQKYQDYAAQL